MNRTWKPYSSVPLQDRIDKLKAVEFREDLTTEEKEDLKASISKAIDDHVKSWRRYVY
tara:strand:- start:682 stop:855 length:174 start_codon:yes stop_codon:yes gene_type:complete